jgi:two-component system, NtrC family, response regulator AtoC
MPATILVVENDQTWSIAQLVGRSPAVIELRDAVQRIARDPASPVLFIGETGTGRSLAAKILHHLSERCARPFASATCTASSSAPLEAAIFGPALDSLRGGTLFMSGLHQAGASLQQKLQQLLNEQIPSDARHDGHTDGDVRLMASADRRLDDAVGAGRFSRALYDRLTVSAVRIPPLRLRTSDVEPLVRHYVDVFNRELGKEVDGVSAEALAALEAYSWPGNVRELKAVIERAMLVANSERLQAAQLALPAVLRRDGSEIDLPPSGINLERLERDLVIQALQRTGGNQTRAATLLGLNRDQVRYRIEKFGLPRQ